MDELIKTVSQRAGVSEEQARKAVDAVAEFVKGRFPALAGHIDSIVKGGGEGGNPLGDVAGKIGGMFGS